MEALLKKYQTTFARLLPLSCYEQGFYPLDLSSQTDDSIVLALQDLKKCEEYLAMLCQGKIGVGGYAEKRRWYAQSSVFRNESMVRNIHLGVDIWLKSATPIYNFMHGCVHSFAYNAGIGNYGGTLIMEYKLDTTTFYVLYGHLSKKSVEGLEEGKEIEKGEKLAEIGEPHENGGWVAHLHFQLITDMQGNKGDFIGVAYEHEQTYYLNLCPNPAIILQLL